MDLGIAGRKAIVCASTQGLGRACATALAREGCIVYINGRSVERAHKTAQEIAQETGAVVHGVAADITTEAGRAALVAACPEADILVNNNAGPPPGKLADWHHDLWISALEANMLAPALLIRAVVPGMRARKFGRIINITSAMVKSPRPPMALSTGARAGLTAFSKSLSLEVAVDNVTINSLLPGPFETDRLKSNFAFVAQKQGTTVEALRAARAAANPSGRFGTIEEFGAACAFLCSVHAGFITGQNWLLDGGVYPGTF